MNCAQAHFELFNVEFGWLLEAMLNYECSILNYYGLNKICLANNVDKAASRHNIQASLILVINKASLFRFCHDEKMDEIEIHVGFCK